MSNIIHNYPKSSCDCYNCTKNNYNPLPPGIPTNMSVRNCEVPPYFNCYDRVSFGQNIQPRNLSGYNTLNPQLMINTYDKDFQKINCSDDSYGCKTVYASTDPRLISVTHGGQVLTLDRPPINDTVDLSTVYNDPKLNGYGQNYRSYEDVNSGQITYYIDKSIEDAFFKPVFASDAVMKATLYQDPMGSMKPQYDRVPNNNHCLTTNTINQTYEGGLSWIRDSGEFRENIIASQMRKQNQTRYEPRWT